LERFQKSGGGWPARKLTLTSALQHAQGGFVVAARLLKPLGNPQPNIVKYFAALEVLELAKDRAWLARMTIAINLHWQKKNMRKNALAENFPSGHAPDNHETLAG
jgi:hypothetical protein